MDHFTRKNNILCLILGCLVFSLIANGCSEQSDHSQKVLEINGYSLTVNEFNELFSELSVQVEDNSQMRQEFLNRLITQKLILQDAQKIGLDKKKNFLKSIEHFWEQSLLKLMIDSKMNELSQKIIITEEEIQTYYEEWIATNPEKNLPLEKNRPKIKWLLMQKKQSDAFEHWIKDLRDAAKITINKKAIGVE